MSHTFMKTLILAASLVAMPVLASTPDGLLTSKTKLTLWTTAGIRSTAVHVDSDDGLVTLYGKVPTIEQKEGAEKAARGISGVRSVRNLLQVVRDSDEKRIDVSDGEISTRAAKVLKADGILQSSSISVKAVDKGVVLLTGDARSISDHLRAVKIVDRIAGVRGVASEVKSPDSFGDDERVTFVTQHASRTSSAMDMRITAAVKLRLLTASQVPSNDISVDTEDRVVTLFGIVPTAAVRHAAGNEASRAGGVASVRNQLEVVPSSQQERVEAKDSDIVRDLGLAFDGRAEFKSVETAVKNGTVRLSGTVGSGWDELTAVRLAGQVGGVRAVQCRLKIDESTPAKTTRRD
jgi:hyperosmotically inducible protein